MCDIGQMDYLTGTQRDRNISETLDGIIADAAAQRQALIAAVNVADRD